MPGTFYQLHSECRMLRKNKHTDMAGFAPGLRSQILPIRDFGVRSAPAFPDVRFGMSIRSLFVGVNRKSGHNDGHLSHLPDSGSRQSERKNEYRGQDAA